MDLHHLRCFVAVARAGSIAGAATILHLTSAPVSRAVLRLERELGTEILNRSGNSVQLTSAGLRLLDEANAILDTVERLPRQISDLNRSSIVIVANEATPMALLDDIASLSREVSKVPVEINLTPHFK